MAGLQADKDILAGLAEAQRDEVELEKKGFHIRDSEESTQGEHELDGIHDGLEFPTEEEKQTLRRVSESSLSARTVSAFILHLTLSCHSWKCYACEVIAVCELAERFSYYGTTVVFVSAAASGIRETGS